MVKQYVRHHNDLPFHGHERGQFYRIYPLLNYPLHTGTPPAEERLDNVLAIPAERAMLARRMENYLTFARDFAPLNRSTHEGQDGLYWDCKLEYKGLRLHLLGLNTALLSQDDEDKGRLAVGLAQLGDTLTSEMLDGELVIVLSHHPIDWLRDGVDVDRRIRRWGHVHLHSHVHDVEREIPHHRGWEGMRFVRIVAGATYGERVEAALADRSRAGLRSGYSYNFGTVRINREGHLLVRIWPRRWSERSRDFRTDVDRVLRGDQGYSEYSLGLSMPAH